MPSTVTKTSPYFQVYGMQPYIPSDFYWNSHVEDNTQREETHVPARLAATQISTLKAVQKRHDQNQKQYARKVKVKYYKPGTLVDVWRPYDVKEADRTRKFTRHWSGPYKVLEHNYDKPHRVRIGPVDENGQWQRPVHIDHVRKHGTSYWLPRWRIPGGWDEAREWNPVAPPYDQRKTRPGEYERRLQEEFRRNEGVDPELMRWFNQPQHGRRHKDGFTPNMTEGDWLERFHQKYPNGFPEETDEDTDDEDVRYPRHPNSPYLSDEAELQAPYEPLPAPEPMEHTTPQSPTQTMEETTDDAFRAPIPSTSHFTPPPTQIRTSRDDLRHRLEERARSRAASIDSTNSVRTKRVRSPPSPGERDEEPPSQRHKPDTPDTPVLSLSRDFTDQITVSLSRDFNRQVTVHANASRHTHQKSHNTGKPQGKFPKAKRF